MNLNEFYELIKNICPTYHYESDLEEYPRQVYTEYATSYEYSSNNVFNKLISINLNHYSKDEFDNTERMLELMLMLEADISFNKETTFDEETKVITNSFDIEISQSMDEKEILQELKNLKEELENVQTG